ncbi:MAG: AAA family ATPase [Kiritimatiellae bacterium]|jgi:predicted AAA+ superfamily ATPase|nr:AAA family ATPase [Kiritimatiellia bacterium]
MNFTEINQALAAGEVSQAGILPKVDVLKKQKAVFNIQFGLDKMPEEPGLLLIRGARQYGKSTWLQQQIKSTIEQFGPGSAYYLNGDEIRNERALEENLLTLSRLFSPKAGVRRIFVDEITAVKSWEKALKRLFDQNELEKILIVTTGSKATDLRRGAERLPGRKGHLDRNQYLFTPLSFSEFKKVCSSCFSEEDLVPAYILSGGSPPAVLSLLENGNIAPYVIEIVRDWIYGEFAQSGRSRDLLLGVLECIYRFGGTPTGYAKVAREAGMANNTVASGYIDQLTDLICVAPSYAWEASRNRFNRRRPCKFHFTNLLAATAWHPSHPRCPADYHALPSEQQAVFMEWTIAQECWRRAALRGDEIPEKSAFWQSDKHEIDFVFSSNDFIEVKRGRAGPLDFSWFPKMFPQARLKVICNTNFETDSIQGITLKEFLSEIS